MPFGAQPCAGGGVRFALWAPGCAEVGLELVGDDGATVESVPMQRADDGFHSAVCARASAGTRYRYRVSPELAVPDPASRSNPLDVHGPSEVVDPAAYDWVHVDWRGRPWHEAVVYELHVGTFTPEGRFESAIARLPELAALGITAIQVMPLADFSGTRGWGYDGVLPFAPEASYGPPEDFKRLVDSAHGLGLMVLLDVVYNHFGPDGNYLSAWCPEFFDAAEHTPWGPALNFGAPTVRRFFVENALYWVEEFGVDGLRLDAIHAIRDSSAQHIVAEIAAALRDGPGRERHVHLVLENDDNGVSLLTRDPASAPHTATAQWNDDLHHAAHVLATGQAEGYYGGYAEAPAALLGRALAEGFVYQGQACAARGGQLRGEPSGALPPLAFIDFLQTHDQIGNRAFGERLDALAETARVEALLACLLLAPAVPMLFMGEEFAASTPFLYFCDYHGDLARAVAQGRRDEFAAFAAFADPAVRARIPDPNSPETFAASRLDWSEREGPVGRRRLALVGDLLALRRRELVPLLVQARCGGELLMQGDAFTVTWPFGANRWILRANFGDMPADFASAEGERAIYRHGVDESAPHRLRLRRDGVAAALLPGTAP